jgi:hypothetical protein
MITQKWWQSKVTLLALAALVGFVATKWIGHPIPDWETFVSLVMAVLAGLGIFNNGYNPVGWGANTLAPGKKIV